MWMLSVFAIVISLLAIFAYGWVTAFPWLGIDTLYHLRTVRIGIAVTAWLTAGLGYWLAPGTGSLIALLLVVALTPLSGFLRAKKLLVGLDDPQHVSATEAGLADDAQVLAIALDERAVAWPLALLVPHHLSNDWIGKQPVLAAW